MSQKLAIFTESEASQKCCPYVRGASAPHNRCLASDCMAWRWYYTHIRDPQDDPDLIPSDNTYGYCGVAGSPAHD